MPGTPLNRPLCHQSRQWRCQRLANAHCRKKLDEQYHFSCQFTADLIAMNASDFIITSTFQEIAGDADTVGAWSYV